MTACSRLLSGETLHMKPIISVCFRFYTVVNLPWLSSRAVSESERFSGDNVIYKPVGESVPDMVYLGSITNFDLTYAWAQDKCVPLVREITFENGEVCNPSMLVKRYQHDLYWRPLTLALCVLQELTEEGIPFLILFHIKEDAESLEMFQQEVARQLISEKGELLFVCL